MTEAQTVAAIVASAARANADGTLGERELLAICMAANDVLRSLDGFGQSYAGFAAVAEKQIDECVAELNQ